jgi:prenyltransferase beta subunit
MKANTNKAIEFLLARGNLPILYWLKKDILEVPVEREYKNLQKYATRIRILESQRENGGWCRREYEDQPRWEKTYYIVETLRNAFRLYDFACTNKQKEVKKLIEFLYSTQSREGDFRGAYLNEYAPTYHALTLEVLCLYGFDTDKRTQSGFRWLMRNRQSDGGWVIPYRTIDKQVLKERYNSEAQHKLKPVKPDTSKPFSHLVTGMVLRAMAASQTWKNHKDTKKAAEALAERFFKDDKYEDRQQARFWEEITYPFWATDVLSGLDSLAKIGFPADHEHVHKALKWILDRQKPQGFWEAGFKKSTLEDHLWVTLSVMRILKNFGLLEI